MTPPPLTAVWGTRSQEWALPAHRPPAGSLICGVYWPRKLPWSNGRATCLVDWPRKMLWGTSRASCLGLQTENTSIAHRTITSGACEKRTERVGVRLFYRVRLIDMPARRCAVVHLRQSLDGCTAVLHRRAAAYSSVACVWKKPLLVDDTGANTFDREAQTTHTCPGRIGRVCRCACV